MSATRRTFLAGLALPVATRVAVALPAALEPAVSAEPHPDAALFAAEAVYRQAQAAYQAAREARSTASEACAVALGLCPPELAAVPDEARLITHPGAPYEVRVCRAFRWVGQTTGDPGPLRQAWTAAGLDAAIHYAVPIFGTGGQTPHRIRRWRSLLPAAKAFDAHAHALDLRFRVSSLSTAAAEADRARVAAEIRFNRVPAKTVEGLAVKVRHIDDGGIAWVGMGAPWAALFQSAAAVAGVTLRDLRFDCERWTRELREAGGSIQWDELTGDVWVSFPVNHRHTAEHRASLTRLSEDLRINRQEIAFWLSQQGDAA